MIARFLPAAAAEVDEAVAWYDLQREGLGREFAFAVADALRRAQLRPLGWPKVGTRLRRVRLVRFPYGLLYAPLTDELIVVAVMHDRRRPQYWRDRVVQLP